MALYQKSDLNLCREWAREYEPARYFAALMGARSRRDSLLGLLAIAGQLSAICTRRMQNPVAGDLRLAWWREAIDAMEGEYKKDNKQSLPMAKSVAVDHPALRILSKTIRQGWLARQECLALLEDFSTLLHAPSLSFANFFEAQILLETRLFSLDVRLTRRIISSNMEDCSVTKEAEICRQAGIVMASYRLLVIRAMRHALRKEENFSQEVSQEVSQEDSRILKSGIEAVFEYRRLANQIYAMKPRIWQESFPAFLPLAIAGHALTRLNKEGGRAGVLQDRDVGVNHPLHIWRILLALLRGRI